MRLVRFKLWLCRVLHADSYYGRSSDFGLVWTRLRLPRYRRFWRFHLEQSFALGWRWSKGHLRVDLGPLVVRVIG